MHHTPAGAHSRDCVMFNTYIYIYIIGTYTYPLVIVNIYAPYARDLANGIYLIYVGILYLSGYRYIVLTRRRIKVTRRRTIVYNVFHNKKRRTAYLINCCSARLPFMSKKSNHTPYLLSTNYIMCIQVIIETSLFVFFEFATT